MKTNPYILAIDTSCDETSIAVVQGRRILSSVVASQTDLHKEFGGVVPNVARRAHIENIQGVYEEALRKAKKSIDDIDYIAATYGPGLAIDLEVGLKFGQRLAVDNNRPFVPVNHMEGHLLSALSLNSKGNGLVSDEDMNELFPALALLVSGKHTEIIYVSKIGKYEKIGQTLDDAAGEAFDKVGRMLNFGYPGGPVVSEFAKKGTPGNIEFTIPMVKSKNFDFSFSGLKTACLYKVKELREEGRKDKEWVNDFCRGFVDAVLGSLNMKLERAIKEYTEVKSIFVGGGVFQSEYILTEVGKMVRGYGLRYLAPEKKFRNDNAGMIGIAAYFNVLDNKYITDKDKILELDREPRLSL
jgi:N6-L-threonylcarbamoyladenine synthase